jgi:predicted O-methyltransferase YrrM
MNSLTTGRVAQILDQLHQEAEATDRSLIESIMESIRTSGKTLEQVFTEMIKKEQEDIRGTFHAYADNFLNVSPEFGRFLYMCARARKAARIVEFGTSMGISTIYLAAALRDMGNGHLIGTELEPGKVACARANLEAAGLADLVDVRKVMRSIRSRMSAATSTCCCSMGRSPSTCRCSSWSSHV